MSTQKVIENLRDFESEEKGDKDENFWGMRREEMEEILWEKTLCGEF